MMTDDRIADPRLQEIMDAAPPRHIGEFLKQVFGETPSTLTQMGSVANFAEVTGEPESKLRAVLDGQELLDQHLALELENYFGLSNGLLMRMQQRSYLDRLTVH